MRMATGQNPVRYQGDLKRLLFIVDGQGTIRCGGQEHPLAREDALLIPATLGAYRIAAAEGAPLSSTP